MKPRDTVKPNGQPLRVFSLPGPKCNRKQKLKDGECVEKECSGGQTLSPKGICHCPYGEKFIEGVCIKFKCPDDQIFISGKECGCAQDKTLKGGKWVALSCYGRGCSRTGNRWSPGNPFSGSSGNGCSFKQEFKNG